jgi:ABC-type branched-subunit amino acid transport system permease subunit
VALGILVVVLMVRPDGLFSADPGAAGMTMQTLPRRLGAAVVTAVVVWILSVKLSTFRDYQIAEVAIEVTAVAGLTVLTGLSGQISLGNGAFMAIGGYTTAAAAAPSQLAVSSPPWWLAAVTAVAGGIVGVAAARLRGPYLAGATSCWASRSRRWPPPTRGFGGDQGLNVVFTDPAFLGANFPADQVAGLGQHRGGAGHPGAAGEPVLQQDRPQLARRPRRRGGGRARRRERRRGTHPRLRGERHLRRDGRRAAGHRDQPGRARAFTITLSIALLTAAVIGGLGSLPARCGAAC